MRWVPLLRLMPVLLLMAGLVLACGGSDEEPTSTPSPQSLIDAAAARFNELDSAHYTLTIDGDVYLDSQGMLALRGAEGDLQRPDRATAKADIGFAGTTLSVNVVALGQEQYMTNFLTGRWERAPEDLDYNPAVVFDPERGIPGVLRDTRDVTLVGEENLDGASAYHLRGVVPQAAVAPMTGNAFQGDPIDFDLWIDRDTSDIRKVVLHDTAAAQGATPATWTLVLSKHNEPVTIEKPAT